MEQGHREPRRDPAPGTPGRSIPSAPPAPTGPGRWEPIALPARAARRERPARARPIVLSVAHGERVRRWAIDPGLVLIGGLAIGALGLGALDRLLVALFTCLL